MVLLVGIKTGQSTGTLRDSEDFAFYLTSFWVEHYARIVAQIVEPTVYGAFAEAMELSNNVNDFSGSAIRT